MKKLYDITAPEGIAEKELEELNHLVALAQNHQLLPEHVDRTRHYLARFPDLAQQLGDISGFSLQSIAAYAAGDLITRESIQASAQEFKRQLARPGDTPLEKFAVDQCVHAHILHYTIELRYINAHSQIATTQRSLYWEQRLTNSQKRYLRALDNLARLRRFAIPPIQINIAENQTNISAASPPSASSTDPFLLDAER